MGNLAAGGELDRKHAEYNLVAMAIDIGLTPSDAAKQVRRGLNRGEQTPRGAPAHGTMLTDRADAITAAVTWWENVNRDHELRTRRGATTKRILAAFALLAIGAGKVRISESYRELAEASGVSIGTITKHRAELSRWVRLVEAGNRWNGNRSTWQLQTNQRALGNRPEADPSGNDGLFPSARTLTDPSDPYWHRWATGWAVYRLLDADDAHNAHELAAGTGLHVGSVRRILARFAAEGIAERDADGLWTARLGVTPQRGLIDHRALRHARHRAEREVWALNRERIFARREEGRVIPPPNVDPLTGEVVRTAARAPRHRRPRHLPEPR
jgi:hypothetical protein